MPEVYIDVAKNYSSPLFGYPPICDELIALVQYMFTEEEASLVRHLKPLKRKTAKELARLENIPVEEATRILDRVADEKYVLLTFGTGDKKRYLRRSYSRTKTFHLWFNN